MLPGLSLGEILILALVALIFLKPEDLPRLMHQAGIWMVTVKRYINGMLGGLGQ